MNNFAVTMNGTTENRNGNAEIAGIAVLEIPPTQLVDIRYMRRGGKFLRGRTRITQEDFVQFCRAGIVNVSPYVFVLILVDQDQIGPVCYTGWNEEVVYQRAFDDLTVLHPHDLVGFEGTPRRIIDQAYALPGRQVFLFSSPIG